MKIALLFLILLDIAIAKVVIDDYGNSIKVPEHITKIFAASPPISMSVLAFNPDLLVGLNTPFNNEQKKYVGSAYFKPVVGGFMGEGKSPNFEILANIKPDVILLWGKMVNSQKVLEKLKALGIPVLLVKNDSIYDIIGQFKLLGKLSGDSTRADELIAYTKKSLSLIESLQDELSKQKYVRYYFAQGIDGLSSECDGSFHLEPFNYAGAKNALNCKMSSNYGMEKISAESIALSSPDVIIAMEKLFYDNIKENPHFKNLSATKASRVYLVPSEPFNYISRPPSFMRLLGIRWLIKSFYPSLLKQPFEDEKKEFEKLFFRQKKDD